MKRSNKCYDLVGLELKVSSSDTKRHRSESNKPSLGDFSDKFNRVVTLAIMDSPCPSANSNSCSRSGSESKSLSASHVHRSINSHQGAEERASRDSFSSPLATLFIL